MKKFVCGMVCGVVLATVIGVGAVGIWDKIDVLKNDITVIVNGKNVTADNFLYNDTTYLPLRAVCDALSQPVDYDEQTNTAYIGEKKEVAEVKSKYIPPKEWIERGEVLLSDGIYYVIADKIDYEVYPKGYYSSKVGEIPGEMVVFDKEKREVKRCKVIDIEGLWYIPYDTFVEEIEPLLK